MSDAREAREAREAEFGYREVSVRDVRIAEWMSGRDDPRRDPIFAALVNRLRVRRWARDVRAARDERWSRLRSSQRRWLEKNRATRDAELRARQLERPVVTCACGVQFCNVPRIVGQPMGFCSVQCQRRGIHRRKKLGRVRACAGCGVEWCSAPWAAGQPRRWCSDECRRNGRRRAK